MIPYGRQSISEEDIQAVEAVLRSDFLTTGPAVERFEQAVAAYCGAKYAVAVNSATSALHIACLAAGLTKGHSLWTSPNTFVASANCGLYCGASVDFVDIDHDTYNMGEVLLKEKLARAKQQGTLPTVVVPVHFSGQSCRMEAIYDLAQKYGFHVIEDASHAIGGSYKGHKVGSCTYSDMTVFSFHPVKIITAGEGGMVLTNSADLYEKLILYRSHGITRNKRLMLQESPGGWYYGQLDLGFNYRMTDIQAALGYSQLQRIDEFVQKRHKLARRYDEALKDLPVILPAQDRDQYSSYHLYVIQLKLDQISLTRKEAYDQLQAAGIGVNVHYIPVHTQPYYQKLGFKQGDFSVAEAYYEQALTLPLYESLSYSEQDQVIETLRSIISQ